MNKEVVIRRRVHPLGEAKRLPPRRDRWPRSAIVVQCRLDATGRTEAASILFVAAGALVAERLVYGGAEPTEELDQYVATHRAATIAGASRRIGIIFRSDVGRLLRTFGHRRGHAIVTADIASQLTGLADSWAESTSRPGAWSLGLAGLGGPYRDRAFKLYRDAPAVLLSPVGDVVLAGWSGTAPEEVPADGRHRRPPARRGPFVDVLAVGAALSGRTASDLSTACATFCVEIPDLGEHPLDCLRAEAHAICALYTAQLAVVGDLGLGLDPSTLVSTGGVATALLREAGVPALAGRLNLPDDVGGAAASAFMGGLGTAVVVHVPVPTVEVDASGTFARGASAAGVQDFLVADHVEVCDAMGWAPELAAEIAGGSGILDRAMLRRLARTLLRVEPRDHVLPVKAVRDGVARLAMAPTDVAGWWWATDVLAGAQLTGGHLPPITAAVELVVVGTVPGLRPMRLPTGKVIDLTRDDLALAIVDERATVRADAMLPAWRRDLLDGLLKGLAVTLFYGNLARVDRERLAAPALDAGLGPDGERVSVLHRYCERPGPYASLALAGMVTAIARLMVCRAIARIGDADGSVLAVNIDSLLVAATHAGEPEMVPCPGGRFRLDRHATIKALPREVIEALLDADDELFSPGGGHLWKREAGFDRPMTAYVAGVYRYGLLDEGGGPSIATEAQLGGVYADPSGTGDRTTEGHWRWAVEAHLAVVRAGIVWDGRGPVPDLGLADWAEHAVVRTGQARSPDQLARLARAFPDRRLRPFISYFQAVLDPLRSARRVVPISLDVHLPPERWLHAEWRDAGTAEALILTTEAAPSEGAVRVRTVRELLLTWRIPADPATEPVEAVNHILQPGMRRVLPVHSRPELVELVGKEGDDLYAALVDPGATTGADLTVYRQPDTWAPVLIAARHLGPDQLRSRTGLARSTIYHLLDGRRPSPETAALAAAALDGAQVTEAESADGWHPCARPGCENPVRRSQRWCSPSCRKAVQRAGERLRLHGVGGSRCRRCGTVRFGDQRRPCPGCGERRAEATSVVCPGCGVERIGDTTSPCRICERKEGA